MYTHMTQDKFEEVSRLPYLLDGMLATKDAIKKFFEKIMKARQAKADREFQMYVKNTADWERLQRDLERNKTHALYFAGN